MNNILSSILGGAKSTVITLAVPIVSAADPAAGQLFQDGITAFNDGKITIEEVETLACDAINEAKERLPKYADAFDKLTGNIKQDIPELVNNIVPHFEATIKAFEDASKS